MRSSRFTMSAITSSSAADDPAVTMIRSGATRDAVVIAIVAGDRLAQCGQAERRRVVEVAARDRLLGGRDHGCRRREVGLADFHVHDGASGGFERTRGRLHLHHVEGRDLRDARGGSDAGLHRRS